MNITQIIGIILMMPAFGWFIWGIKKYEEFRMGIAIVFSFFGFIAGILMLLSG